MNFFRRTDKSKKVLVLWDIENCRLPKSLWRKDYPTQVATRLSHFFGRDRGLNHPELYFAFRNLPPNAPFSNVLEELRTPGGFEYLAFLPKFHQDGTAVKNHNADDVLKEKLTVWMRNNPEGGLVVFMTSDTDFLKDIKAVVENYNFRAELIFFGDIISKAPGMREKVNSQGQCHEWMEWLRGQMQMPQLQMHPFNKQLEWEPPSGLSGWGTAGGAGRDSSGPSGSAGIAGAAGSGRDVRASIAGVAEVPRRSGAAVLEVPRHGSSQPAQRAAARMFGFPPHAAPDTVMAVVDGIMSRMPHLSYAAECAMNNGFPVANLTFPDLGSAKQAVQKLHGQCHGALRISMELISSLQAQPVPQAPHAHAAGPSQRPAGMQPIPHHPRPPPRVLPTGNVVPWQTNQQPYSAPVTGFPNGVASSSGQTRAPQPFLGHASGSPANFGGPAPPPPPAAVGGHVMSGRPTGSDAGGRVTACVQQSSDRPKLIQKILEQFRGDAWQTCKEYEDLKVKLSRMKVLFDTGIFASTGQVRLHRGGNRQDLHAAKKMFEDFFRVMEDMNAPDEEVVLRPRQYSRQQLMYLVMYSSDKLRGIAEPFGVHIEFKSNQQQQLQMVARGKPFKMNDFLTSFDEQFEQPNFVERGIIVPCTTLCPIPFRSLHHPGALLAFAKGQLQYLGAEVQKAQDVMISVDIVHRPDATGNSNAIRILIIGTSPIPADASHTSMQEKVREWRTEVRPIPAGRQQLVHTFVMDYMRNVKDCHLAEAGAASLVITCSSDDILTNATQAFEQVLAEVKPVTLPYTPDEKVGFILRKRHWLPLVKAARADRVQMHYPQALTFLVAGPKANAEKAMARLQTASAEVLQSSITLKMPLLSWQLPWFFDDSSKRAAKTFLNRVASQHAVWWNFESPDQQAVPDQAALSGPVPPGSPRPEVLLGVQINGHLVQVYKEDITKHACGAIVNAANCKLLHTGGVAAYISTAAGPHFQAMCSAEAAALPGGAVEVGNCLVTDAGELPCTKVIHAMGPNFAEKAGDEPELLCKAVTSALQAAAGLNLPSLALPLVSSGAFGCPVQLAADIAVAAVIDFLQQTDATEVHFVDIDGAALQAILASLKEQAGHAGSSVQQHASVTLQSAAVGYVNGMEWGFHDVEQLQDISYSVEDCSQLEKQYQKLSAEHPDSRQASSNRYYHLVPSSSHGMLYQVDLHLMQQSNSTTGRLRPVWHRKAAEDKVAGAAAAQAAASAGTAAAQQAASSINLEDEAGPSTSAAGQAASAAEDAVRTHLTLFGKEDDCKAAELAIQEELTSLKETSEVLVFPRVLSQAEQAKVLEACRQAAVLVDLDMLPGSTSISLMGVAGRVSKGYNEVVAILLRAQAVQYPSAWEHVESQVDNLQLYDVDPASSEVADLVAQVQASGHHKVLKVERIQNKVLYQYFDEQHRRIANRWAQVQPDLNPTTRLWHGTRTTDPSVIYDSEEGFSALFGSVMGMWGRGTYFSTTFSFASTYSYAPTGSAADKYKPDGSRHVRQVLVADVLTGKHKMLPSNDQLTGPPEIEDPDTARQLTGVKPRYDSVAGIHPHEQTPIFITYTSAATSYPSYLVTFE
ncbi:poly ADP-ribose polymerase [Trebouxia sp. C0009 RCD-2024]